MLYIGRKVGESIIINDNIKMTVLEVRGKSLKLGFEHPSSTKILREEVFQRIQQENKQAAESALLFQDHKE